MGRCYFPRHATGHADTAEAKASFRALTDAFLKGRYYSDLAGGFAYGHDGEQLNEVKPVVIRVFAVNQRRGR